MLWLRTRTGIVVGHLELCISQIEREEELVAYAKRPIVSTIFGIIAGIVCYLGGKYGLKDDISTAMLFYILVNRALIGFVIGISPFKMNWAMHGLLMGLIVGIPFAAGCLLEENNLETAIAALVLGAFYGLMIEFFTSVVFRARKMASFSPGKRSIA
jgi:hypothetical protein